MTEHPASEALRAASPDVLREALISDLRDGERDWVNDVRDLMVALAPYHDCALRLGLDVAATFRDAADDGPASLRHVVVEFGVRRDVTPAAFGFAVVEGPDGPSYQAPATATRFERARLRRLTAVKRPAPEILRRGSVVRVGGNRDGASAAAPAYAISYVDLRFDDGHVERWLGSGSLRDDPADPVPYSELVAWGADVALEHAMIADLGMSFYDVDRQALSEAPVEVVFEWNAKLPEFD